MIVPMKRLTLLCLQKDRQKTLDVLEQMGVVHVTPVRAPSGEELDAARQRLARAEKALTVLSKVAEEEASRKQAAQGRRGKKASGKAAAAQEAAESVLVETPAGEAVVDRVERVLATRKELEEELGQLRSKVRRMAPFGDFDPALAASVASAGVGVFLAQAAPDATLTPPEGVIVRRLGSDDQGQYLVIIAPGRSDLNDLDFGAPLTQVPVPEEPPAVWRERIAKIESEVDALEGELATLAKQREAAAAYRAEVQQTVDFLTVREGMGEEAVVAYLQGYVPAEEEERLRTAAKEHGWGVVLETPRTGEPVPTLLRYKPWVKPIMAVLQFLGIYPGYEESDIGWTFLIFFSLFFAILIGDAAYGILLLLVTVVLSWKFRHKVPGYIRAMLGIVGSTTFVWGVLSGTWLGLPNIPEPLKALSVPWLADRDNVIWLCFLIGATHLTIAHVWNAITASPKTKALAELGWICVVWTMFFLAGNLVIGRPMPSFILYVLGAGIVLVIVFMATPSELKTSWINHALLPLTVIGNFVDVVSYVRLFAVGFASVAVIQSFNSMASSIGFDTPIKAIMAVLILVFAHSLNLVLGALAVLVHAVRLNTLEFSTHKGLQWQGFLYKPFARR